LEPTRPLSRSSRPRRPLRFSREPGRPSGLFRVISGIFTLLVVCMALVGGGALLLHNWVNAPGPLVAAKAVVIPRGETTHGVAARLEREGAITDRWLFIAGYYMVRLTAWGDSARPIQLKAGEYPIPRAASIRNIVDILSEGKTTTFLVLIPEGLTSHQIVERLKANPNLAGEITEVPEEGSLLPDTYSVPRGASRQGLIDRMRAETRKLMDKMWSQRQKDLPIKTWEEAVVLASIVEKETGRNDERELVAGVFINRLKLKMRLGSDPTIRYGIDGGKTEWGQPILKSERAQKNAHNTYQIHGLPPTPICNPGRAAIAAVLNPASTKALYFVANGKGGHVFAETYEEHKANEKKWRVIEREIREKEKEKDAKAEKEKEAKADKDSKAKASAPGSPPPSKGPDRSKGAVTSKSGATEEEAWSSTTEPAQSKAKR
ncbi:MAG: endolytic transglycosylase MltG, partial [Hyphomicrobiaceae bacterium]